MPPEERFHDYPGMLRGQYHIGRPDVDSLGDAWQVDNQGGEVREEGDRHVPWVLRLMLLEHELKVAYTDHRLVELREDQEGCQSVRPFPALWVACLALTKEGEGQRQASEEQ